MKKLENELCPCNSKLLFQHCCQPFLYHYKKPINPEELMRSRYTAYFFHDLRYIQETMKGKALANFDLYQAKEMADLVEWTNLKVISSELDPKNHSRGFVEFIASYTYNDSINFLHEKSEFQKDNDEWFYIDGETIEN